MLLGVALIAKLVAAKVFGLGARLDDLRAWIVELGAWGPLVFIALDAVRSRLAAMPLPKLVSDLVDMVEGGLQRWVRTK